MSPVWICPDCAVSTRITEPVYKTRDSAMAAIIAHTLTAQ